MAIVEMGRYRPRRPRTRPPKPKTNPSGGRPGWRPTLVPGTPIYESRGSDPSDEEEIVETPEPGAESYDDVDGFGDDVMTSSAPRDADDVYRPTSYDPDAPMGPPNPNPTPTPAPTSSSSSSPVKPPEKSSMFMEYGPPVLGFALLGYGLMRRRRVASLAGAGLLAYLGWKKWGSRKAK